MKKIILSLLVAVIAISVVAFSVSAAPGSTGEAPAGPYEGIFYGTVEADNNSRAPMLLQITHRQGVVQGNIYLGQGLYVDGGRCGGVNVPSGGQYASGNTIPSNPNRLVARSTFNVSNFNVTVDLTSDLSPDGKTLDAAAKIDLPWICGEDPQLSGTLQKIR